MADAGGKLLVTPNTNPAVIAHGVAKGMTVMPGFYTPSEGFAAVAAGAKSLKLFPASSGGIDHLKAMLAVLPKTVPVYAVGGVGAGNMREWKKAGAAGFGLGSRPVQARFQRCRDRRTRAGVRLRWRRPNLTRLSGREAPTSSYKTHPGRRLIWMGA